MEVHHHSHKPKKISEYFTEFIMLFAAVTLGFFAENYREHQIEKHREIQYLKNIHLDLERDIVEIDRIYNLNIEYQQLGNEFIQLYDRGYQTDLPRFYYLTKTLALKAYFQRSQNGIDQLKNAGGMRLIKSSKISDEIANYWHWQEYAKAYGATTEELKLKARERSYNIFNQFYYNEISRNEVKTTKSGAQLMTYDKTVLTEYANRLSHIKNSIKNQQLYQLDQILSSATILLNDLKKEYEVK